VWLPSSNSLTAVETHWVNGKLKSLKINSCERPVTKALLMLSAPHRLFVWGVWLFQGISLTRPALLRYPDLAAATITGVPFLGRPTLFRAVRINLANPSIGVPVRTSVALFSGAACPSLWRWAAVAAHWLHISVGDLHVNQTHVSQWHRHRTVC